MDDKYNEILKYKPLSIEEEVEYVTIYSQTKDEGILEKLIKHNLRFVYQIANEYHHFNKNLEFDDIFNEGVIGLIKGIKKFDVTVGVKLISYCVWWIRQSILLHINSNKSSIKIPTRYKNIVKNIDRFNGNYFSEHGFYPTTDVIVSELGYTESEVTSGMRYSKIFSTNQSDLSESELVKFNNFSEIIDNTDDEIKETINQIINNVKGYRDKDILLKYFGIGCEPMTYKEIGDYYGITSSAVSAINARTLTKIRRKLDVNMLTFDYKCRENKAKVNKVVVKTRKQIEKKELPRFNFNELIIEDDVVEENEVFIKRILKKIFKRKK